MRVGADQGIWKNVCLSIFLAHLGNFSQVFQVHLVDNPSGGRYDFKIIKCLLAPMQKFIALAISGEFDLCVFTKSVTRTKVINLHGMVDDYVDRNGRINIFWSTAFSDQGSAHSSQVIHNGYSGKV